MKPLKIWCHLDNFYFHCFMGGTKGKNLETLEKCQMFGIHIWESCSPFDYEGNSITGNGNQVNFLKLIWKNLGKHIWIYFCRVFSYLEPLHSPLLELNQFWLQRFFDNGAANPIRIRLKHNFLLQMSLGIEDCPCLLHHIAIAQWVEWIQKLISFQHKEPKGMYYRY